MMSNLNLKLTIKEQSLLIVLLREQIEKTNKILQNLKGTSASDIYQRDLIEQFELLVKLRNAVEPIDRNALKSV